MAQTIKQIISRALRLLNVAQTGETGTDAEASDALAVLNQMLGSWNNDRLLVFGFTNELFDISPSVGVYTIGPTGAFVTTRPFKIERAFVRFNSGSNTAYDFQLEIVPNSKYQEIFLKNLPVTYPVYLYYNPTWPDGTITLWPYPNTACKIGISQWTQVNTFVSLTQEIELPQGYEAALAYNLAVELSPEYGRPLNPVVVDKAAETKAIISRSNMELSYLKSDSALLQRKAFNIISGAYQ